MDIPVNAKSDRVQAMGEAWRMAESLLGGTAAMRAQGKKYLHKATNETQADWEDRRDAATLFPAFARTVGVMVGKPLSKQLTLGSDVPADIAQWCDNCDREGQNLHTFMGGVFTDALAFGLSGVLVEYPPTQDAEGRPMARTKKELNELGARPYLIAVRHHQILGWRSERVAGAARLTQLRIAETGEDPDGEYGVKEVHRVRVLRPGSWQLWREDKGGYVLEDEGRTTLNAIPFVPFYGRRAGFMSGESPLINLAHLNVKHWQHQSEQDKGASFSKRRLLVLSGVDSDDDIIAGPDYAIRIPLGASVTVVQGSAESVVVGRSELDALEAQMIQTGAELLVSQPGGRTATEANNDAEANKSELQHIVEGFEDSIDQCLQVMADWRGLAQGGHASLFKDFASGSLSDATAQLILSFQQGGLLTKRQALVEAKRIGILSPDVDPDRELEMIEAEGPSLGAMTGADGDA